MSAARLRRRQEGEGEEEAKGRRRRREGERNARVPRAGGEGHAVLTDAEARDAVLMPVEDADAFTLTRAKIN